MQAELTDEQYDKIMHYLDEGDDYSEQGDFERAIHSYVDGLEATPDPKTAWETSLHLYVALGDAYLSEDDYLNANNAYNEALQCPDALDNPYVWLRLGETYYELGNMPKSKDALMSAYLLDGDEIFSQEDEKYYKSIQPYIEQKQTPSTNKNTPYKTYQGKDYTQEE